jgi:hypothetical protein
MTAETIEEKSRRAWELSQRLAKEAMYAGVYGKPFPEEINNLRGNVGSFFRTYYNAGAAIGRRVDQSLGIAAKRPTNGKTRTSN